LESELGRQTFIRFSKYGELKLATGDFPMGRLVPGPTSLIFLEGYEGCFYIDVHEHPEICTPEVCSDCLDLMMDYVPAGYSLVEDEVRRCEREFQQNGQELQLALYNNNVTGYFPDFPTSFGTHENYQVRTSLPLDEFFAPLVPLFPSNQLVTGAGRLVFLPDGTWRVELARRRHYQSSPALH
jgi:hypothetical protein